MKRSAAALVALVMALFGTVMLAGAASAAPAYPPQPPVLTVGTGVVGGTGVPVSITNMKPASTVSWTFQKVAEAAFLSLARTAASGSATSTVDANGLSSTVLPITEAGRYSVTATGTNSGDTATSLTGTVTLTATTPVTPSVTVTTATTDGVQILVGPGLKPGTTVTVTMTGCGSTVSGSGTVGADGSAVVSITGAQECTYTAATTGVKVDGTAYANTSQVVVLGVEDDCADSGASGSDCDSSGGGGSDGVADGGSDGNAEGGTASVAYDSAASGSSSDTIAATGADDSVTLLSVGVVALLIGGTAVLVARSRRWGDDEA